MLNSIKMIVMVLVIGFVVNTGFGSIIDAFDICDYKWTEYNGHQYALTLNYLDWIGAQNEAVSVGGTLAVINGVEENEFVMNFIADSYMRGTSSASMYNNAWIGLEGFYPNVSWVNGEELGYTNFDPHYIYDDSNHWYITGSNHPRPGIWNCSALHDDFGSTYNPRGVIEVVPEPATLCLLGIGSLVLFKRKKKV